MTLTKAHIVEELLAENLFTKTESTHIVETLFELIKQSLNQWEIATSEKRRVFRQ